MITEAVVVYIHPNGSDYVANFTEYGWRRWPATEHGWLSKRGCPATLVDSCEELDPKHARMALQLSGAA